MKRAIVAAIVPVLSWHCGLVGPSCVARQERGSVASFDGQVDAGAIAMHQVRYGTEGSQNNVEVSYDLSSHPPRLRIYATRIACADFRPSMTATAPECAVLASGERSLIVTHGRGNPAQLGPAPEYRLWIVGDEARSVRYHVEITYFYGPDC